MREERITSSNWSWDAVNAALCFGGGILAGLLGSLLTSGTWIWGSEAHPWVRRVGTLLLIVTIPLLILAGHCLDRMESRSKLEAEGKKRTGQVIRCVPQILTIGVLLIGLLATGGASDNLYAQQVNKTVASHNDDTSQEYANRTNPILGKGSVRDEVKAANKSDQESLLLERIQALTVANEPRNLNAVVTSESLLTRPTPASQTGLENRDEEQSQDSPASPSLSQWQYGGFFDLAYLLDFNHPANHLFRSRGTAFRVDSVFLNMAAFYIRKKATEQSRWGIEATAQAGKDAEFFGFSATAPNIGGHKSLRQLGPTNVSYLAPVSKGLALQAGIFTSLIGYDSLYAKDNFNYTRPWGADFTPYFMMGANASYPFNEKATGTFFVVNGYWHLARANNVPSSGGQIAYKLNPRVTLKETVLVGPHQSNKSFKFWRFLTDTIVERKTDRVTLAFEYIYSQERVDAPGNLRALMMSSQLPVRWTLKKRWAVAVRPEVFWDRDGRWTLARQTVKAFTTTLEYRLPYRWSNTIFRLEHRFDDSRGPDGGFFRGREVQPGVVDLTPNQHLLIFATIFTFDR